MPIQIGIESVLDIVVETIFGGRDVLHNSLYTCRKLINVLELFFLPYPPFRRIYYGLIFMELCKESREYMPGVLARAIHIIYDRLNELDVECYIVFTEWFAHHLANFDYKWLW